MNRLVSGVLILLSIAFSSCSTPLPTDEFDALIPESAVTPLPDDERVIGFWISKTSIKKDSLIFKRARWIDSEGGDHSIKLYANGNIDANYHHYKEYSCAVGMPFWKLQKRVRINNRSTWIFDCGRYSYDNTEIQYQMTDSSANGFTLAYVDHRIIQRLD